MLFQIASPEVEREKPVNRKSATFENVEESRPFWSVVNGCRVAAFESALGLSEPSDPVDAVVDALCRMAKVPLTPIVSSLLELIVPNTQRILLYRDLLSRDLFCLGSYRKFCTHYRMNWKAKNKIIDNVKWTAHSKGSFGK